MMVHERSIYTGNSSSTLLGIVIRILSRRYIKNVFRNVLLFLFLTKSLLNSSCCQSMIYCMIISTIYYYLKKRLRDIVGVSVMIERCLFSSICVK